MQRWHNFLSRFTTSMISFSFSADLSPRQTWSVTLKTDWLMWVPLRNLHCESKVSWVHCNAKTVLLPPGRNLLNVYPSTFGLFNSAPFIFQAFVSCICSAILLCWHTVPAWSFPTLQTIRNANVINIEHQVYRNDNEIPSNSSLRRSDETYYFHTKGISYMQWKFQLAFENPHTTHHP